MSKNVFYSEIEKSFFVFDFNPNENIFRAFKEDFYFGIYKDPIKFSHSDKYFVISSVNGENVLKNVFYYEVCFHDFCEAIQTTKRDNLLNDFNKNLFF